MRPRLDGVRMLAIDGRGRVLLVRHAYGTRAWMAPGGGLRRNEDPLMAAVRELGEEVGCGLSRAVLLDVRTERLHGARNRVRVVAGEAQGDPVPDRREIVEARFFALDSLPADMPQAQREALPGWVLAYCSATRPLQPQ